MDLGNVHFIYIFGGKFIFLRILQDDSVRDQNNI
jgi:hypothetical protein